MPNNFKRHSLEAIEKHMSEALTEFFGQKTFFAIEQMETTGPEKKSVKLVAIAGPDRRVKFEAVPIERP